ncbi:hypothetical protein PACTADRAFT_49044 [Pachysolen tannophilus NRRL Y-2460]|uniref:Glutamate--cysteine ligase n=1 Tax=Pachysolen tannophilus NRRL Y-2460 TaxID=669874 RepID=A0A1E4TZZ3_PACTA|nr:hypothetical protein PACTADRAFT_49044 [Pachysolen tannophilus NRRL Y-2460]
MGLLSLGTPLHWKDTRKHADEVREQGIIQLIKMFESAHERKNDKFLWGDELEYMLLKIDEDSKDVKLAIDEDSILQRLSPEGCAYNKCIENEISFHPEYGRYMLEATPARPYDGEKIDDYLFVEKNMSIRRKIAINELHDKNVFPFTLTVYPRMGTPHFTYPDAIPNGEASKSLFLPDEIINRHVRFPTLTANIRRRRGAKVAINVPLYKDTRTRKNDEIDPTIPKRNLFPFHDAEPFLGAALPGHIYMDSMGFGMGCSCLQVTMQTPDLSANRYLYDSLVCITPIMLALTAASPIFRGFLADQDVRWNVISGSVDDRTPYERGVEPLKGHNLYGEIDVKNSSLYRIPKSRYDSVDQYLGDVGSDGITTNFFDKSYNDLTPVRNEKIFNKLTKEAKFDEILANHFAHLFIRDPIVVFSENLKQDNDFQTDHFENIQSTNWQTLRFKPPIQQAVPENHKTPGWRVEFRPMEISITDFENAAYAIFVVLLSRSILKYRPNFYLPITCVDKNMKLAHKRESATNGIFYFRKNILSKEVNSIAELSLNQIINGSNEFIGLIPLIEKFLNEELFKSATEEQLFKIRTYLKLVSYRASGEIPTTAKYIRNFVLNHPNYAKDSIVSKEINFDLIKNLSKLTAYDKEIVKDFFGNDIARDMEKMGYC